jgi:hypothetical protein
MASDFSTPERALATLEDAYRAKDMNAAVAAKDFRFEAHELLLNLKNLPERADEALIMQTAEVLELAFRKQIEVNGFPDFARVRCQVISKTNLRDNLVELMEECIFPDGGKSTQTLHFAKNESGWHLVVFSPC